jgi:hypothetical protein
MTGFFAALRMADGEFGITEGRREGPLSRHDAAAARWIAAVDICSGAKAAGGFHALLDDRWAATA